MHTVDLIESKQEYTPEEAVEILKAIGVDNVKSLTNADSSVQEKYHNMTRYSPQNILVMAIHSKWLASREEETACHELTV